MQIRFCHCNNKFLQFRTTWCQNIGCYCGINVHILTYIHILGMYREIPIMWWSVHIVCLEVLETTKIDLWKNAILLIWNLCQPHQSLHFSHRNKRRRSRKVPLHFVHAGAFVPTTGDIISNEVKKQVAVESERYTSDTVKIFKRVLRSANKSQYALIIENLIKIMQMLQRNSQLAIYFSHCSLVSCWSIPEDEPNTAIYSSKFTG